MNILIIISSLNFGGAEKQAVEDANVLSGSNKVVLVVFAGGALSNLIRPEVECLIVERKGYLNTAFKLAKLIRKYKIDIIHAHLYAPMIISALAGTITKTPVLWNFHSHAYENSSIHRNIHRIAAKLPSVKKILFPAKQLEEYYKEEGYSFPERKSFIAYNSGQHVVELATKTTQDKVHIGYIGRIIPLKRIEYLIELAEYLLNNSINNFVIDIVGNGSSFNLLIEQARQMKLTEYVTFHGFQHDTLSYYRNFDLFAFPSREEVLSLSLIDAGLTGLPSVVFDVGGNKEIVNNGVTGLIVESKKDFFTVVADMIGNAPKRVKMGAEARKHCSSKFSTQARYDVLTRIYEEAL